jgi:beta-glucosidase
VTADSGEGYITVENAAGGECRFLQVSSTMLNDSRTDRNDLELWHGGVALVQAVAKANKNTIVVVQSVGPVDLEAFADLANG